MLTIFRAHADVLEAYRDRFHYILVDEYQDTNASQYDWLKLLAEPRRNLCCVGDDDQSIYSWRGAEVANILRFENDFPGAKVIRLEQNYRSTPHILAAATGLIAHNAGRLGKTLWTEVNEGDRVKVIGVWDGPEEARRVGEEIEAHVTAAAASTIARSSSAPSSRPASSRSGSSPSASPTRSSAASASTSAPRSATPLPTSASIAQPADDLAFERIVNQPKRGLGDKAVANIHAAARRHSSRCCSPPRKCSTATNYSPAPGAASAASSPTSPAGGRWHPNCPIPSSPASCSTKAATPPCSRPNAAPRRPAGSKTSPSLRARWRNMKSLGAFLEHVSLVMDNDSQQGGDKVTIMTIHAAKGLEFPLVFLAGWEEGVFPSQRALDEGGLASLEEERRLAYVAITRARRQATILHAANRRIYGQWTSSIPSRFVAELPKDHIDEETTMTGGESLWRAQWSERGDPFAHVARPSRGPGWQRASSASRSRQRARGGAAQDPDARPPIEARASAVSLGNKGRDDLSVGQRVFHGKFGYGTIEAIEGNKLEIEFEKAGRKRVLDSFISIP